MDRYHFFKPSSRSPPTIVDLEKSIVQVQFPTPLYIADKRKSFSSFTTVDEKSTHSHLRTVNGDKIPDGGWQAWLTVLGAFLALFCTFGQLSAFGTFQSWYEEHQLASMSPSTISWIGSLQLWVFFFSVGLCSCLAHECGVEYDFRVASLVGYLMHTVLAF